jgi:hypothetical protein
MASPQVCGVLACLLEQKPSFKQTEVIEYLNTTIEKDKITDTGGGYDDDTSLQGSNNNYIFYKKEREEEGYITPKFNYSNRKTFGQVYPRNQLVTYSR